MRLIGPGARQAFIESLVASLDPKTEDQKAEEQKESARSLARRLERLERDLQNLQSYRTVLDGLAANNELLTRLGFSQTVSVPEFEGQLKRLRVQLKGWPTGRLSNYWDRIRLAADRAAIICEEHGIPVSSTHKKAGRPASIYLRVTAALADVDISKVEHHCRLIAGVRRANKQAAERARKPRAK
jgi:hypothetical protein